jgi:hypothetical protein
MKKSINGANRADDAIALSNVIADLLSGKATNLEAINLAIKGFAVKCVQQRGHQVECKLNGKSSAKTNPYYARIAKEAPTHELEAKAAAKAERVAKKEAAEAKAKAKRIKLRAAGLKSKAKSKASSKRRATAPKRAAKRPVGRPRKARPVGRPKGSKNRPKN